MIGSYSWNSENLLTLSSSSHPKPTGVPEHLLHVFTHFKTKLKRSEDNKTFNHHFSHTELPLLSNMRDFAVRNPTKPPITAAAGTGR